MEFNNIISESEIGSFFYQVQTDVGAALLGSLMKRGPPHLGRHTKKELRLRFIYVWHNTDYYTQLYRSSYRISKVD